MNIILRLFVIGLMVPLATLPFAGYCLLISYLKQTNEAVACILFLTTILPIIVGWIFWGGILCDLYDRMFK